MMNLLSYIVWNPDLEAFRLGPFAIRWYGLMWLIGFALGYFIVKRLYKEQKIKDELFDPLFIYCFFGILIGARLGHCIFYQPQDFLTSWQGIIEMLLPIRLGNDGSWLGETFGFFLIGYAGLASHGGTLGLMIALWLYVKKSKLSIWTVLDNIAIATGSMACCIRLGNLMNSEIIGKITDVPWAFIFERVDKVPRHSRTALRGHCLRHSVWYPVVSAQAYASEDRHWLVLWLLPDLYLHLPLLHRVYQGDTRSLRSLPTHRYGTDTLHPIHHPGSLLHEKG